MHVRITTVRQYTVAQSSFLGRGGLGCWGSEDVLSSFQAALERRRCQPELRRHIATHVRRDLPRKIMSSHATQNPECATMVNATCRFLSRMWLELVPARLQPWAYIAKMNAEKKIYIYGQFGSDFSKMGLGRKLIETSLELFWSILASRAAQAPPRIPRAKSYRREILYIRTDRMYVYSR